MKPHQTKDKIRSNMINIRREISPSELIKANAKINQLLVNHIDEKNINSICCYTPLPGEPDITPFIT